MGKEQKLQKPVEWYFSLIFTPDAIFASCGGALDLLIYLSSVAFLFLPTENSGNNDPKSRL